MEHQISPTVGLRLLEERQDLRYGSLKPSVPVLPSDWIWPAIRKNGGFRRGKVALSDRIPKGSWLV